MDVMKPLQRHRAMASNRGRTKPEIALARALWRRGLRYLTAEGYHALTGRRLIGQPDIVFARHRLLVFVDGCFWHGCPQCKGIPQDSGKFWKEKIEENVKRDSVVTRRLSEQGWRVVRVPEHELRTKPSMEITVERVAGLIDAT